MRVWRYNPVDDALPTIADAGDLDDRRAVFLAAPADAASPEAWLAVDDCEGEEGTVLFGAPPGEDFREYVCELLSRGVEEATAIGFTSLLAHWRAGWSSAESVLMELGFTETAPGLWRRQLVPPAPAEQ